MTWIPASTPPPQNRRREAAVDLEFPVTFLRGEKLNEEEKSPILRPQSQEAGQQASRRPATVIRNVEENRLKGTFQSFGKSSLEPIVHTSILGPFSLCWRLLSMSDWQKPPLSQTICSFSISSCPDPAARAELRSFLIEGQVTESRFGLFFFN